MLQIGERPVSTTLNLTVFIGNGFDLSAGMKTDTAEFMDFFANKHESDEGPVGRLAKKILEDGPQNWADFEKKLGEYAQVIEKTEKDPASAALDCKGAVDEALIDFIDKADSEVTDEFVKANAKSVIGSLACWFGALQPREQGTIERHYSSPYSLVVDFVTFNYTSLLPRLYAEFGSEGQTIPDDAKFVYAFKTRQLVQIHSSLSRDPVCGVNDTSQIASNDLASNSDIANTYVKSEIQKLLGSKDDSDAASLLARADVLIIFGLSLGESDAQWWAAVVEQLKRNASLFVVIASLDVPTSRRIPTAYLRLSKKIKGRLLRFGGVSDKEADTLSKRILIIPSEKILRFKETLQ